MKTISPIAMAVILAMGFPVFSYAQHNPEKAKAITQQAIELMDDGQYDESIRLLEKARSMDSTNYLYDYEIALAHVWQEQYDEAIEILENSLTTYEELNPQVFQLLGNAYDLTEQPDRALDTYNAGIEQFPDFGNLYYEKGVVYAISKGDYNAAMESWETGIRRDPFYPSNYFYSAKLLLADGQKIWGLLYGEVFINLEPGTDRTREMSKLLYDTYASSITIKSRKKVDVDLVKGNEFTIVLNEEQPLIFPADLTINLYMQAAVATFAVEEGKTKKLTPVHLSRIREHFLSQWSPGTEPVDLKSRQSIGDDGSFALFDWHQMLVDAELFEIYNRWLFRQADIEAFGEWYEANEVTFNIFAEWMNTNRFPIDPDNVMCRTRE